MRASGQADHARAQDKTYRHRRQPATYRDAGLTSGFHEGAEWIYEVLSNSPIAEESRDEADAKKRSLDEVTEIYHRALLDHLGRV